MHKDIISKEHKDQKQKQLSGSSQFKKERKPDNIP